MQPPIPPVFLARMAQLLDTEYPAFVAAYDAPPVTGMRVNTLKITPAALKGILPFELAPVPWSDEAFAVADDSRPGKHPYHAAGLYYVQDPSALAAVVLLDPQPGERILDLSAAPGGKATHIAARLQGDGLLLANEIGVKRAWELAGNLERWGVRNAAITMETPERLAERLAGFFDAVLVDAPCSGEGMFRKSAAARQEWAPALVEGCAVRQRAILHAAAELVRPGGRLVYATCTFAPAEDEGAVAAFLRGRHDFELTPAPRLPGFSPGQPSWLPPAERTPGLELAVRLWPQHGPGEGHFAALLQRRDGASGAAVREMRPVRPSKSVVAAYHRWCADNLHSLPATERLALDGSYLYALPRDLPDLIGLRTAHPGWWLGTSKGDRFEPSHALAMSLRGDNALRTLDLVPGENRVFDYLRGQVLDATPGEDGWTLVTVSGFPLGWGKRVGGRLKNLFPKGLRWL